MGVRKVFFLLVSAWLINSMVCFHGSNPFESSPNTPPYAAKQLSAPQSLLLWLCKAQRGKTQQDEQQTKKIEYRYRYIASRYHQLEVVWKAVNRTVLFDSFSILNTKAEYQFPEKSLGAVTAHLLLFRLTPF